jgi:FixJ family two-component response regulator
VRTIRAGAEDFLTKPVSAVELFPAIERAIARRETTLAQKKAGPISLSYQNVDPARAAGLRTCHSRQNQQQTANALGRTERTIKAHHVRVMEKLRPGSLAELVSLAERVGFLCDASGSQPTEQG